MDLGFDVGSFGITDSILKKSFTYDLYLGGKIGVSDTDNNFQIVGRFGYYQTLSRLADDTARNFKLSITPLQLEIIVNLLDRNSAIQPYVGGGAGAYLYSFQDDVYGSLETGTRFGLIGLAGLRFNINPNLGIIAEYQRWFCNSPVFRAGFPDSTSFNSEQILLGVSVQLEPVMTRNGQFDSESRFKDQILSEIDQVKKEIDVMKESRIKIESAIDDFYNSDQFDQRIGFSDGIKSHSITMGDRVELRSPITGQVVVFGKIVSLGNTINDPVIIETNDGWQLPISVANGRLTVANKFIDGISMENLNTFVEFIKENRTESFAKQLRVTKHLEMKLVTLNEKIQKSEAYLGSLRQSWNQIPAPRNMPQATNLESDHFHSEFHRYRPIFNAYDYSTIITSPIPTTPLTPAEKEEYIKKKQEYIKQIRNRK